MKTKEFIKKVEELGFGVRFCGMQIRILANDFIISVVYTGQVYGINTCKPLSIALKNEDKLFELMVEYVKTPLDERKEEKKFYLRHRWFNSKPIYKNYLNYWIGTNEYWLDYKNETAEVKTQFTEKEIENIKNYNNTDLKDFKKIEVKE